MSNNINTVVLKTVCDEGALQGYIIRFTKHLLLPIQVDLEVSLICVDHGTLNRQSRSIEPDRRQLSIRVLSVKNGHFDGGADFHSEISGIVEKFGTLKEENCYML